MAHERMTQGECESVSPLVQYLSHQNLFPFRFALKLLDKKRIKVKKGELLALNERNMLARVS